MNDNYFLSRRSCRNFKPEKVNENTLKEVIEKASKAPTCGNMQLYSVIVTRDEENLKKLAGFHFNQPASTTAPVILTICADFYRFSRWCEINNAKPGYDNFHSFVTALTDAVIFAQQITTIAEMEGLGTCYLGTVNYNAEEIAKLLDLPELVVPVASLAIGWPKSEGEATDRLPANAIIHEEKYRKDSDNEIETQFRIHDENPVNEKFIKENGKQNLAQVFTDIRYPKSTNESVSESFSNLLKQKNFLK